MKQLISFDYYKLNKEKISSTSLSLLRFFFVFYILLLPIGTAPREIGVAGCIISLVIYYIFGYGKSNLKKYPLKKILFFFCAYILLNALIFSINPGLSAKTSISGVFKGIIFLLVGMEFVRSVDDIKKLVCVFTFTAFYEGLDGVYQAIYGYDLIRGTESWENRLTGSLNTPRVGNLMSLLVPIALGSYFILKKYFSFYKSIIVYSLLLFPALFLLYGARTRSGWIGFIVSLLALLHITRGIKLKKIAIILVTAIVIVTAFPGRANIESFLSDARFELWSTSISIFTNNPITGSGFNTFEDAYNKMGIVHLKSEKMPHPHNIYMQFLAEGGAIGIALLLIFLFGNFIWSYRKITLLLQKDFKNYFFLALFWSSYAGYLATAISAHSFFRLWWLSMGMSILGITLGGCLINLKENSKGIENNT